MKDLVSMVFQKIKLIKFEIFYNDNINQLNNGINHY